MDRTEGGDRGGLVALADRRWLLPGALGVLVAGVVAGSVMGAFALVPTGGGGHGSSSAAQPLPGTNPAAPTGDPGATPSQPTSQPPSPAGGRQPPAAGFLRNGDGCLRIDKEDNATRTRVDGCAGGDEERWQFRSLGGDEYQVSNARTGRCLDVKGRSDDNGAVIQQFTCHDQENQRWRVGRRDGDTFSLVSVGSGKCADVEDDGDVKQRDCDDSPGQRWTAAN
jgi:hypothetical protein